MFETPDLFVADEASVSGEKWRRSENWEMSSFEPGYVALCIVCAVVDGHPRPGFWTDSSPNPVEYVDGPPDPSLDEGFQLHRISGDTTKNLAALDREGIRETVESWRSELAKHPSAANDDDLERALNELNRLATDAVESGKAVFVHVLVR
jgi:hypothetical protein